MDNATETTTTESATPPAVQYRQPSIHANIIKYSLTFLVGLIGIYSFGFIYTKGAMAAKGQ